MLKVRFCRESLVLKRIYFLLAKPVWLEGFGEAAQVARKREAEWRNFVNALCDTWRKNGTMMMKINLYYKNQMSEYIF